ncbi:MAG: tRNA (adenosine(37)-N6)-threonylcarbamoyltransferase complex transferase subunit TsaD [Planctomycetes bacterium]|nr:tRNA (adenosine(37)-N6)-threonylcarbamoyltransferase complex transferase subunit TsaD [Planctomycetota bacterium]
MRVLGIETSCDETAAAVVENGQRILSNVVASQQALHQKYGGVVPEIACRAHVESITAVVEEALSRAGQRLDDLDAVAVANTPGLIGALLIGVSAAKALAWALDVPLVAVSHVAAHIYANHFEHPDLRYPLVTLVASGGHTSLFHSKDVRTHELLGATTDDAAGEAFDKVASILGLGYPGGPAIDKAAQRGNPKAVELPRAFMDKDSLDFSFSGLKTAVLYRLQAARSAQDPTRRGRLHADLAKRVTVDDKTVADIAASFQEAVVDVLSRKALDAVERVGAEGLAVGGGVACNSRLRAVLREATRRRGIAFCCPSPALCTDNAAMVAGLAYHKLLAGDVATLDLDAAA